MSFLITAIIHLIDSVLPVVRHRSETNSEPTNTNTNLNSSIRNNRRPRRRNRRYRRYRIDLNNNFQRAHLILRARQITERNRALARLAEQSFIDAIFEARTETGIHQAATVHSVRTRNERPPRAVPGQGPLFTVDNPAV
jgi:hypothetical protein